MCDHQKFMKRAAVLSLENIKNGTGGPFGAVIVRDGKIIGEGSNSVTSTNDPTAHAEVNAIRNACKNVDDFSLEGATIYSSCEPCPMCLSAIYWARIEHIYYSNTQEDAANIGFDDAFLYKEVKLPKEERSLPIEKVDVPEAKQAFDKWDENQDKIEY